MISSAAGGESSAANGVVADCPPSSWLASERRLGFGDPVLLDSVEIRPAPRHPKKSRGSFSGEDQDFQ